MSRLSVREITKKYGNQFVLKDFTIETEENEFVVVVGPSGCGKSTLLNIIAGLVEPTNGKVMIDGNDVTKLDARDRNIAMVFQDYALYDHMTVQENIGFYLKLHGIKKKQRDKLIYNVAKTLHISKLLARKPETLSGGQKQRVAIARAIIRNPSVFLFDEPLSNLDYSLREQLRKELIELHQKMDTVFLYVTHDQTEALSLGDRIVVFNEYGIQQMDTPERLYNFPENKFVASFIGMPCMNFISEKMYMQICLNPDETFIGNNYTIGIRPEKLKVISNNETGNFIFSFKEMIGKDVLLHFIFGTESIVVSAPANEGFFVKGEKYTCIADKRDFHFFDFKTGRRV